MNSLSGYQGLLASWAEGGVCSSVWWDSEYKTRIICPCKPALKPFFFPPSEISRDLIRSHGFKDHLFKLNTLKFIFINPTSEYIQEISKRYPKHNKSKSKFLIFTYNLFPYPSRILSQGTVPQSSGTMQSPKSDPPANPVGSTFPSLTTSHPPATLGPGDHPSCSVLLQGPLTGLPALTLRPYSLVQGLTNYKVKSSPLPVL